MRESTLVSAKDTIATANPPIRTGTISAGVIQGMAKAGRPCGSEPRTDTPRSSRPSVATRTVAPITAISTPGKRLLRLSSRMSARVPPPTSSVVGLVLPASRPWKNAQSLCSGSSALTEKPKSLGSWLISTVKAMPFM